MSSLLKKAYVRKFSLLLDKISSPNLSSIENSSFYWRERVFKLFSLTFFSVVLLAYLYYTVGFIKNDQLNYVILGTTLFVFSLFITIVRSLSFKFRSVAILTLVFLLGGFIHLNNGPLSLGLMILLVFSMLSGILHGIRASLLSIVFNLCLLSVVSFFHYNDTITNSFITNIDAAKSINIYIVFLALNLVTLIPLITLLRGMNISYKKEERYKVILNNRRNKLSRAEVLAEQSDSLKTAFLSNMSHEIRTPMNAILGFSNLLSHEDIGDEEKKEFVDLIKLNGRNLLTLVEDLIDISKIDSGQIQIKNSQVCLHEILMEVYDSYAEEIKRRGKAGNMKLYLKEGIADPDVRILADSTRLRQVLVHLVGNAIKFTEHGYVEFGYSVINEGFLQFYVKDTGIGVPKGKEDVVFERFNKLSDENEKLYGGTGIGLSIAKDLVNLMGGDINYESERNIGTTFYFTIPLQRVNSKEVKLDDKEPVGVYNWEGKTFLVVEDEEDNFRYLEVALSISNASLIWARNGVEAVDIMNRIDNIDLILMDIKMPEMDGYTATKEIKAIKPNVPIIAQTAYAMSEEREKSIQAGCDDYIAKPIGYEDLLKTIQKFVPGVVSTKKELLEIK